MNMLWKMYIVRYSNVNYILFLEDTKKVNFQNFQQILSNPGF